MRDNIFQNIVNDENSFTELLCNMMKYDDFKNIFLEFIGINDVINFDFDTQYRTGKSQANGRPDFIVSSENDFIFIEIKIGDANLTRNQPKGYLKELSLMAIENKYLYFILPRNYKFEEELKSKIEKYNTKKINTGIFYWDAFFELLKLKKGFQINDFCAEYYNLIKDWYGYEHTQFFKKENLKMDKLEIGKFVSKIEGTVYTIGDLLSSNGYKIKYSKAPGEFGFDILNKKNKGICWFGAWVSLWAKTGEVIILTLSSNYENKVEGVKKIIIDDVEFQYFCLDKILIHDDFNEQDFLKILINKIQDITK
jgi:hypothetical protein